MRRASILLTAAAAFAAAAAAPSARLPESASGSFTQKKTLADVGVTIESTGTFEFVKDRSFTLRTLQPAETTFTATPTNYAISAFGKTFGRAIDIDVSSLADVLKIREVRDFIADMRVDGTNFPFTVTLDYKNGDRLELVLRRE